MGSPVITLLTDFGYRDPFVAAMKGVILSINPEVAIVDITHSVESFNILSAAFILDNCFKYYPTRTLNVIVVDPGVGTQRRPILACGENHYFLAPDNGVLSYVFKSAGIHQVFEVNATHYFRENVSKTFHGRDIFAPVAGYFSKNPDADNFGELIKDYVSLNIPKPRLIDSGTVEGKILYVDHFGNLITNVTPGIINQIKQKTGKQLRALKIGEQTITGVSSSYEDASKKEFGMIHGSTGYMEIFCFMGNAAVKLRKKRGDTVHFIFG